MFGYEYIFPPPAELQRRRQLLDQAGYQGYAVPVILLITVYIYRLLSHIFVTPAKQVDNKNSIYSKAAETIHERPSGVVRIYRRLQWTLNTTYTIEYGPLYIQIIGLLYTTVLLYIIIAPTQHDYLHLTKAFGHVAVSQLPLLYALSLKTPLSPITLATGLTHERLNAFHRLLGGIVHMLVVCHVLLYLNFFIAMNVILKRIKDTDVLTGVAAFWSLNLLAVMAMPYFRKIYYYKGFYRVHVVTSALIVAIIWFHVPYTRIYVGQASALWLLSWWSRRFGRAEEATVSCMSIGNDLVQVVARLDARSVAGLKRWKSEWYPGMHAYLIQDGLGPKSPLTVLSVEQEQNDKPSMKIAMVARNHNGPMTRLLSKLSKNEKTMKLTLEGPYGAAGEYMPHLLSQNSAVGPILVVAGGVGATYALPIYMALLKVRNGNTDGVKLLWIAKKLSDCRWGVHYMLELDTQFDVEIYVTGHDAATSLGIDDVEKKGFTIHQRATRPNMKQLVDAALDGSNSQQGKASVMVCGPSGLAQNLRTEVGRHIASHGTNVAWYEEQFGFGGS